SRRRHTRFSRDWSSDVCSSDLSMSAAVRSGSLVLAISSTWARVSVATLSRWGRAEPDLMPAAFLMSTVAGGVFMMKVKLLSANRSEEHTSELQSRENLVCRLLL